MSHDWWYNDFYPPSRPRPVKGGIKAQSKRGAFANHWWAKRWIAVLESFHNAGRLTRGRSYARRGQVVSVKIEKGQVSAKVQGSMPRPYTVTIALEAISMKQWQTLATSLSIQAIYVARLLAGEMPEDIETVFAKLKLSLFPEKLKQLKTDCSCPDPSNPCKHIAAVYYLLAEEFDRDPFLLFQLRGIERQELIQLLGDEAQAGDAKTLPSPTTNADQEIPLPMEPISSDPARFWRGEALPINLFGEVRLPPVDASLLKRLGKFPFWRGEKTLLEEMEPIYREVAKQGMETFLGRQGPVQIID